MLYAKVEGNERATATPKASATCPCCDAVVKAKCGSIVSWHWSHISKQDCDSFSEPMTQWHLNWQQQWQESAREVTMVDTNGTRHRADVYLQEYNTIIELQHSSISLAEVKQREQFYGSIGTLVWVVDISDWADTEVCESSARVAVRNRPAYAGCSNIVFNLGESLLLITDNISSDRGKHQYNYLALDKATFVTNPVQAIVDAKEAYVKAKAKKEQAHKEYMEQRKREQEEYEAYLKTPAGELIQLVKRKRTKGFTVYGTPALNKEGFSKLTYLGYYETEGRGGRDYITLEFAIMDTTRKLPILLRAFCNTLTDDLPLELSYIFGKRLTYRPTELHTFLAKVSLNNNGYYVLDKQSLRANVSDMTEAPQHMNGKLKSGQLQAVYTYVISYDVADEDNNKHKHGKLGGLYLGLANARKAAEDAEFPEGINECKVDLLQVDSSVLLYLAEGNCNNISLREGNRLEFTNENEWNDNRMCTRYTLYDNEDCKMVDTWEAVADYCEKVC